MYPRFFFLKPFMGMAFLFIILLGGVFIVNSAYSQGFIAGSSAMNFENPAVISPQMAIFPGESSMLTIVAAVFAGILFFTLVMALLKWLMFTSFARNWGPGTEAWKEWKEHHRSGYHAFCSGEPGSQYSNKIQDNRTVTVNHVDRIVAQYGTQCKEFF